jgi:hypothetical protein
VRVSGYLAAIGAKEIEPFELIDRIVAAPVETREGPEALRRAIWRDESGAEVWVHLNEDAPQTTTVLFRGTNRVTGRLGGFSPPVDGPFNGLVMVTDAEPALTPRLVLDLAEFGDASTTLATGRRVTVGIAGLLTEGHLFADRAAYLAACSRRGGEAPAVPLFPVGLRLQGDTPNASLGATVTHVEERRNSLSGEGFLVLTVEWEGHALEVAANPGDLRGSRPSPGSYLAARVWLVGFDLAYATTAPSDPARFPLRPGDAAAFAGYNGYLQLFQVTRVESHSQGGLVVHLRVFAELFDTVEALQAHPGERQLAITHLPLDAAALLDSDFAPLGRGPLTGVDEAAYTAWRQALEQGQAGIFAVPLDQLMNLMASTQQANEEAADEEPVGVE